MSCLGAWKLEQEGIGAGTRALFISEITEGMSKFISGKSYRKIIEKRIY